MNNLEGKVALVTGAAGAAGLGRAIALRLARDGADLVVNDLSADASRRHGLGDVVTAVEALGRRALAITADITDADQVDRMIGDSVRHFGRLDVLVNNAGAPAGRDRVPLVELDEADFDLVQRVNVKGAFLTCKSTARAMIAAGDGGRIINISSSAGQRGLPLFAAYCASKFALRGLTQSLALELAPYGITVNAICPGLIATERIDDMALALAPPNMDAAAYKAQMIADAISSAPLGRLTETDDIANLAAFLASDQSSFITGQSLTVDGGRQLS